MFSATDSATHALDGTANAPPEPSSLLPGIVGLLFAILGIMAITKLAKGFPAAMRVVLSALAIVIVLGFVTFGIQPINMESTPQGTDVAGASEGSPSRPAASSHGTEPLKFSLDLSLGIVFIGFIGLVVVILGIMAMLKLTENSSYARRAIWGVLSIAGLLVVALFYITMTGFESTERESTSQASATSSGIVYSEGESSADMPASSNNDPPNSSGSTLFDPVNIFKTIIKESAIARDTPQEPEQPKQENSPAWVLVPPKSSSDTVRMVVTAGPHPREIECKEDIDLELIEAAENYLDENVEFGNSQLTSLSADFLRNNHLIAKQHLKTEMKRFSPLEDDQPMLTLYYLLEFNPEMHKTLSEVAKQSVVESRLTYAGFSLVSLLLLLSSGYGYLRIDQLTEGRFRGRLRLGVGVVILTVVATGAWMMENVALA